MDEPEYKSIVANLNAGVKLLTHSRVALNLLADLKNTSSTNLSDEAEASVSKLKEEVELINQYITDLKDKLSSINSQKTIDINDTDSSINDDASEKTIVASNSLHVSQRSLAYDQICQKYLSKGFCIDQDCQSSHCYLPVKQPTIDLHDEEQEESMDIYDPSEDYRPTDESRICKFYMKDGKCWKRFCTYEHIRTYKWTHDVLQVCTNPYNSIALPAAGTSLTLTVTGIESPVTLYCHLPNEYSDIGENIDHFETLADLERDMNHREQVLKYSALPVDPAQGETLLVKIDKKWYRATVTSCNGPDVTVFLVDYGVKNQVDVSALRVMIPRFMHLPFQAVTCRLAGTRFNTDSPLPMRELNAIAVSFLSDLVLHHQISALVKYVDYDDECIYISATIDGEDLSGILLKKGFCSKF